MFHSFKNQEERRIYGGTAFIELQYCRMKRGTSEKKIVSLHSVCNWQNDSLYVYLDEIDEFLINYRAVLNDGLYNNMKYGEIDIFGINYYSPIQLVETIKKIESEKPIEYSILLDWLKKAQEFNGFYVLGI